MRRRREIMRYLTLYLTVISAALGAVMGSFLNCWAQRYEAGEKYPRGRSRCPECGHTLSALELVPIFSWVFLRGRCRSCHKAISARYPITEILGAVIFAGIFLRFGLSPRTAELMILAGCLMLLSFIDFDTMILPNGPMIVALISWAAFLATYESWKRRALEGLITALALGGTILIISLVMDKLLKKESLGGGDVKLLALVGLYLGPWNSLMMIILACLIGLMFAIPSRNPSRQFPFGPAIALATVITALVGDAVIGWYVGLW